MENPNLITSFSHFIPENNKQSDSIPSTESNIIIRCIRKKYICMIAFFGVLSLFFTLTKTMIDANFDKNFMYIFNHTIDMINKTIE